MKKLLKRIRHWDRLLGIPAFLISIYLKFVYKSSRWQFIGQEGIDEYIFNTPVIACFWHNRVAMIPFMWLWPNRKVVALISSSPIGKILSKAFKRLNIDSIGGSSSRNPISSYRDLLAEIKKNNVVAIIPDGPRGPALTAKMGFVHLASKSGAAIIPLTYAISHYKPLQTWDQTQIPLPFSRGIFVYGNPIHIPPCDEEELETHRLKLEKKLTELQNSADNLLKKILLEKQ